MVVKRTALGLVALLAAPAGLSAQGGADRVQETYRDWTLRCGTFEASEGVQDRLCEIAQDLTEADSGQRVLSLALRSGADGSAALTMIAPFGLRLSEGIAIDIAEDRLAQIAFRTCLPAGCIASAELDPTALTRLSAASEAQVLMTGDAGQALSLTVSLTGFAAAWDRLGALAAE